MTPTLTTACEQGRQGAQQASDNAGREFTERARSRVLWMLRRFGSHSGEELVDDCKAVGIVPHDDRAFGTVFASLLRESCIKRTGTCPRAKGHGSAGGSVYAAV